VAPTKQIGRYFYNILVYTTGDYSLAGQWYTKAQRHSVITTGSISKFKERKTHIVDTACWTWLSKGKG